MLPVLAAVLLPLLCSYAFVSPVTPPLVSFCLACGAFSAKLSEEPDP